MCFTGRCGFEDVVGGCTVTQEETAKLIEKFGEGVILPCPEFMVETKEEMKVARDAILYIEELRKGE